MKSPILFALGLLVAAPAFAGCGHTGALREEASMDLNCPESRIRIMNSGRTRDVEGCGQSATYRWSGRTWVREGQPQGGNGPVVVGPPVGGPPPVNPAQPAPKGPQPVRVQPAQPAQPSGPNAPLPPSQPPPGQSL